LPHAAEGSPLKDESAARKDENREKRGE